MPTTPVQRDTEFELADVQTWGSYFGWSDIDAAEDLGLGIVEGVISVIDTSSQAKKNRNRAKAIIANGG